MLKNQNIPDPIFSAATEKIVVCPCEAGIITVGYNEH